MISRILRTASWAPFAAASCLFVAAFPAGAASRAPIRLVLDATEAPRHVLHARLTIPVQPGPLTLLYPKWIPGQHSPSGPLDAVVGITITARGRTIPWRRDAREMYAIHLEVPRGTGSLEVAFDYLLPLKGGRRLVLSTPKLAFVEWNQVVLYPGGVPAESLIVQASLRVPDGWRWGTALPVARSSRNQVEFQPAALVTLVDSPVLMGGHFRVVKLAPELSPPHELDMAADSPEALEIDSTMVARHERLVREAAALFGAHHYRRYHFLLALTDDAPYSGLEHHESSSNRLPERTFLDSDLKIRGATLFSHELVHSWNGKHRRPANMTAPPFLEPMEGELLWVYEGLTDYLAWVLAARSGFLTPDQARDKLAETAAYQDHVVGRNWRPLLDTAVGAHFLFPAPRDWQMWRRDPGDFYDEGVLIWLDADALIRGKTAGQKSLDDFCRKFHGGAGGKPSVRTYTFDEVIETLNSVAPHDWRSFFDARVTQLNKRAPVGGIEGGGWRLAYADSITPYLRASERARKRTYLIYSVGILADREGEILDLVPGMAAAEAGLSPGVKMIAVNGRKWSPDGMREALDAKVPIEILAESSGFYSTYSLKYRGGSRYPQLIRESKKPDYLKAIMDPRTSPR